MLFSSLLLQDKHTRKLLLNQVTIVSWLGVGLCVAPWKGSTPPRSDRRGCLPEKAHLHSLAPDATIVPAAKLSERTGVRPVPVSGRPWYRQDRCVSSVGGSHTRASSNTASKSPPEPSAGHKVLKVTVTFCRIPERSQGLCGQVTVTFL
jgi:hypothetical protein